MKILWVTNTILPAIAKEQGIDLPYNEGWMKGLLESMKREKVNLSIATSNKSYSDVSSHIEGVSYYLLKSKKNLEFYDSSLEKKWQMLIKVIQPDVIHIHGTEYAHGLALMKACPEQKYIISIQGLIHVIYNYYEGGISFWNQLRYISLRDIIRKQSLIQEKRNFKKRGETIEKEYLKRSNHVIGRTLWDFVHATKFNPGIKYHHCNESLRPGFYTSEKWNKLSLENQTILVSQANYPLKGLHMVLDALHILKEDFPNLTIRIAGGNTIGDGTFKNNIRLKSYGLFLKRKIYKLGLSDRVYFTGKRNELQMIEEYKNASVFVCPSSVENSSNSIGEAQLLGVPVIASFAGGNPQMVKHLETGLLYRFEEVHMLAYYIKQILSDIKMSEVISANSIEVASKRHDPYINARRQMEIYSELLLAH